MLPNFLIVGAEKAGTTSAANTLAQHPEIFMPAHKEPRFFSGHNWDKGLDWYRAFFEPGQDYQLRGEASPAYTWYPEIEGVPERIADILGDIRYIYIVRDPVSRLISHYRHGLFCDWYPQSTSFAEAMEIRPQLKVCGNYYYQLEQYLPYTSPEQWHIVSLEELSSNPLKHYREIFAFLGADPTVKPEIKVSNVTSQKEYLPKPFKRVLRISGGGLLSGKGKRFVKQTLKKFVGKKIKAPKIPTTLKAELYDYYQPDIERLCAFAGKDFRRIWEMAPLKKEERR